MIRGRIIYKKLCIILLTLLIMFLSKVIYAAVSVTLQDSNHIKINRFLEYFEDKDKQFTIEKVKEKNIRWKPAGNNIHFGYSSSDYWFRFVIDNKTKKPFYLEIDYPMLDFVELYIPDKAAGFKKIISGDRIAYGKRPVKDRFFLFKIDDSSEKRLYYLKIRSESSINFSAFLWPEKSIIRRWVKRSLHEVMFFGFMLAVILYNVFFVINKQKRANIYLLLFLVSWFLFFLSLEGFAVMMLWPSFPVWANTAIPFFALFTIVFMGLFLQNMLNLKEKFPVIHRLLYSFILPALLLIVITLIIGYKVIIVFYMLVLTIIILFYIFKKGIKTARFLLFAMLPVFLMHIFIILNKFGILDQNFILMWGTKISVSWMFLLFTFSLFDRISLINARLRKNEDMLESASTGILTFDLDQKLTYVNNSLLDMWGYDKSDELMGSKVTDLLGDKKYFNKSMKFLSQNEHFSGEFKGLRKDGTEFDIRIISDLVKSHSGNSESVMSIVIDISRQKHIFDLLRIQRDLSISFSKAVAMQDVLQIILDAVYKIQGINAVGVYLAGRESKSLNMLLYKNIPVEILEKFEYLKSDERETIQVMKGENVFLRTSDLGISAGKRTKIIRTIVIIPIKHENKVIAALGIGFAFKKIPDSMFNTIESISGMIGVSIARAISENALKESEKRFSKLFEDAPVSLWEEDRSALKKYINELKSEGVSDFEEYFNSNIDGIKKCVSLVKIIDVNQATMDLYESDNKEYFLKNIFKKAFGEEFSKIFSKFMVAMINGAKSFEIESKTMSLKGAEKTVIIRWFVPDKFKHSWARIIVSMADITKLKEAEKKLENSLKQKEVLLKEIHHRVKNNLNIVHSLLEFELAKHSDSAIESIIKNIQNRIIAMALIHQSLYLSEDLSSINFQEYAESIILQIFDSYRIDENRIIFKQGIEDIVFNIETAIPCGLIINELITNSLKYAFPGNKAGKIGIYFKRVGEDCILTVEDNGIGFDKNFNFELSKSLGLFIVKSLTEQLHGTITLDSNSGVSFKIRFKY